MTFMNPGILEILFIIIILAVTTGVLVLVIAGVLLLLRRIHTLETRIDALESRQELSPNKAP